MQNRVPWPLSLSKLLNISVVGGRKKVKNCYDFPFEAVLELSIINIRNIDRIE